MAKLTIDIEARLANFQDSLAKIERQTGSLAGRLDKAFSGVTKALGPLTAVLSGGLFVNFIRGAIEAQAALDDLKDSSGLTVEFLSQLQGLARVTGDSLESVAGTASRFARSIDEALSGNKELVREFEALGISVEDLQSQSVDQLFERFAKAIAATEDPARKLAAATTLAGRAAAENVGFFDDLAKIGLRQATVSAEQAAKAEELLQSWRRLTATVTELGNALATFLVPRLTDIAGELARAVEAGNTFTGVLRAIGQTFGFANTETEEFVRNTDRLLKLQGQIERLESTGRAGQRDVYVQLRIDSLREEAALLEQQLQAQRKIREQTDRGPAAPAARREQRVAPIAPAAQKALREVEDYAARINAAVAGAINESAVVKTRELQDTIAALDRLFFEGKIPVDIYASALENLTGKIEGAKEPTDELAALLERTTDAVQANANRLTELADNAFFDGRITERQRDQLLELVNGYRQAGDAAKETANAGRDIGLIFVSAAEDALAKWEGVGKFFKGLEQDLIRFGTRKLLTEPLAELGTGLFKDLAKGGGAGIFESLLKLVGFRADGGPITAGRPYVVGERGPELIVPRASGTVMPAGSYGGVNITVNMSGSADRRSAQQVGAEVGRAVQRAQRRNG